MSMETDRELVKIMDDLLCRKWTLRLLVVLNENPHIRFNQIKEKLDGISGRTLSKRLKKLEKAGIVERKSYDEIPPKVEYFLSEKGEELIDNFEGVMRWGKQWL